MTPSTIPKDVSLVSLANRISSLTAKISSYLTASSLPQPNFSPLSAVNPPNSREYETLRASLNDTAQDLLCLVNGPKGNLRALIFSHYDHAALGVALRYDFFHHVPLPDDNDHGKKSQVPNASIGEIAAKAGIDEDRTARVLDYLATRRIFKQVAGQEGRYEHTADSALLVRDVGWSAMATIQTDEMFKAATALNESLEGSPYQSDTKTSAFFVQHGMTLYQYYDKHADKATTFSQAMSGWSKVDRQLIELQENFDWAALKDGKVVDVGGGSGHISIGLAKSFPSLNFIVQDISPFMLAQARDSITPDLADRLTFQQCDYFSPQSVHDASAFFLRQCLHNYNDDDCIKIIRALVPALEKCKEGTPVLINDVVLPEHGTTTRYEEHSHRQLDLIMMVLLGSKQRSAREFKTLFKRADPRFEIKDVKPSALGQGLVIVHLNKSLVN